MFGTLWSVLLFWLYATPHNLYLVTATDEVGEKRGLPEPVPEQCYANKCKEEWHDGICNKNTCLKKQTFHCVTSTTEPCCCETPKTSRTKYVPCCDCSKCTTFVKQKCPTNICRTSTTHRQGHHNDQCSCSNPHF